MIDVAALRHRLTVFTPPSPEQADMRARMLALCEAGAAAWSRGSYEPGHFTASAFVVSPDRSALLLILHRKLGLWLQPGGHVDPDDADVMAAARREAAEEAGLCDLEALSDGIWDVDIHRIPENAREPAHLHFDVRFLFRSPSLHAVAASDARQVRWAPLSPWDAALSDRSVALAVARLTPAASSPGG